MNNESTNRTFQNTNVLDKHITDRGETDLGTPTTSGSYDIFTATRDIAWRTISSKPTFENFINFHFSAFVFLVYPGNIQILELTTGTIQTNAYTYINSFVSPSGNSVQMTYTLSSIDTPTAINWKSFDIIYSSKITEDDVVGFV